MRGSSPFKEKKDELRKATYKQRKIESESEKTADFTEFLKGCEALISTEVPPSYFISSEGKSTDTLIHVVYLVPSNE